MTMIPPAVTSRNGKRFLHQRERPGATAMTLSDQMYNEAMKLKNDGDLAGCVAKLEEILASDPDNVLTHSALGVHLQKIGRNDEAIQHALRVTELEPNDAFSFTQLSVIYQRCGKIPEAEAAMERARTMK
ncbi:MAG: hypothetical protein ACKVT0_18835 [Planctomycetaceae bacterium]